MTLAEAARVRRRVFLHVGSPKTGTTFLQQVLWSQRELARQQGLLLPLGSFHDHYLATLDVRGLAGDPGSPPRTAGAWQRLVDEAETWDGNVLISHELFAGADAGQAAGAVAAFGPDSEVHVVVTARDLVRQIPAEWQEHVKHRTRSSFPRFVEKLQREDPETWFWLVQDFASLAARWGAGLPASRIHLVTVPPAGVPPQALWQRFAGLLGLDPDAFDLEGSRSNTSLGYEQAELLRRVNRELGERLPIPGPYPAVVKTVFAERLLSQRPGAKLGLGGPALDFAVRRSAEIAEQLRETGLDVVGDLDDLVPRLDPATAPEPAPRPSDQVLLRESVAALAALLEEYSTQRQEAQQVSRRLETLERDVRERPVRLTLLAMTARWSWAMAARKTYWRLANLSRRVLRHRGR